MADIQFESHISDEIGFPVEVLIQDSDRGPIEVAEHWHTCFELLYFLEGQALQWINREQSTARQGDIVLIRSGDIHAIKCPEQVHTRIFVLKFMPSVIDLRYQNSRQPRHLFGFLNQKKSTPVYSPNPEQQREIQQILGEIETEYQRRQKGFELCIRGLILQLVGLLVRSQILVTIPGLFEPESFEQMNLVIDYMEQHFSQELSLRDIAALTNMNYSYMSRLFKKLTGRNFKQYLDYIRVSEVSRMILESRRSLTDISGACGFSCPQAMTRTYTRMLGFAPSELRKVKK
ncbi:MAG: AraC family transcriptional regulator [Oscillospiraceae bacterium]